VTHACERCHFRLHAQAIVELDAISTQVRIFEQQREVFGVRDCPIKARAIAPVNKIVFLKQRVQLKRPPLDQAKEAA
jgi:hypothetical protein